MFISGTKVRVLESSVSKSIGPRVGSEGFIVDTTRTFPCTLEDLKANVFVQTVIFTKYGNEERYRKERRSVINLFPLPQKSGNDQDPADVIDELRKKIRSEKSIKLFECIKAQLNLDKRLPIVFLVPAPGVDLLKCHVNEFRGWFDSILSSEMLADMTQLNIMSFHFKNYLEFPHNRKPFWEALLRTVLNRHSKEELINEALKNRTIAISNLRMAMAPYQRNKRIKDIEYLKRELPSRMMIRSPNLGVLMDILGKIQIDKEILDNLKAIAKEYDSRKLVYSVESLRALVVEGFGAL